MPEDDQTKWIGIRPTNPAENIPVTESAPLTSIQVEPVPGCAYQNTNTRKITPAIADLQAPQQLVRQSLVANNVGAPNYDHDLYTVPAGKIFVLQFLNAYCEQIDPTSLAFIFRKGVVNYFFYWGLYTAAWEYHIWSTALTLDEGEILRVRWNGTLAATDVHGAFAGYIIDKY